MGLTDITIGIDIGGTNTAIGFIDFNGKLLMSDSIPTLGNEDIEKFIMRLHSKIISILDQFHNQYNLAGIGVAAPNANYFTGLIETPANLSWRNINFVELMKYYFKVPTVIINDADAAAIGEYMYGQAKGIKNFIEITLGTGLGCGIFVDGNILLGKDGLAGEFGHAIVEPYGRQCNCGRKGCLETYVSAGGLRRTVYNLLSYYIEFSNLRDIPFNQLTSEIIYQHALKGDSICLRAFDYTGQVLGKSLANISLCFSPEAIILFGGLANSDDLLLKPTIHHFEKSLLNIFQNKIRILKSSLQDGKAAVLGAGSLILKEIPSSKSGLVNKNYEIE